MKFKTLLLALILGWSVNAQAQPYTFSVSTGTYTDLVGSTSLNNGFTWDDPSFTIPIGFDFEYFDFTINEIFITGFGEGGLLTTQLNYVGISSLLAPYGADLIDRGYDFVIDEPSVGSLSNLSYLLEGTAGSRILKIEWNNIGFYGELQDDNISSDFVNFQLWLYEATNDFEIHFGNNSISQPDLCFEYGQGPFVVLIDKLNIIEDTLLGQAYQLVGEPIAPALSAFNYEDYYDFSYLDGTPLDGTIYKFSKTSSSVSESQNELNKLSIYPNPSTDYFNMSFDGEAQKINKITILNTDGQIVKQLNYTNENMDISDLISGVYFVQIHAESGVTTKRLLKL